jgi:hypothetical protein
MGIEFTEPKATASSPKNEKQDEKHNEPCLTCPKIFTDPATGRVSTVISAPSRQEIIEPESKVGHVTTTNGGRTHIGSGAKTGDVYTSGNAETNIGVIKK